MLSQILQGSRIENRSRKGIVIVTGPSSFWPIHEAVEGAQGRRANREGDRRCFSGTRANPERNFQMAEAKWPVCQKEAKANVRRPWPCADDAADRPLRPGRLPSTSERTAWERAGAQMGRRGPIPFRGLWLCCVGRPSLGGKKGSHPFLGIGLPPRLASYKGMMGSPSPHQRCHHFGNLFWDLL